MPAFIVAGAASGSGKTLITLGILEALKRRGLRVQAFKAGPDYIDPGLHRAVLGRPSYNLDTWMMGAGGVKETFARAVKGADCAVIEGVMGLFDGRDGRSEEGSTAHLSKTLGVPVLLVANAEKAARSMGAVIKGFEAYDPGVDIRWALFNKTGSHRHSEILRDSMPRGSGIKLLGCIKRDEALGIKERHLGLVTASEDPDIIRRVAKRAADAIEGSIDLGKLLNHRVKVRHYAETRSAEGEKVRIAVAIDKAFSFYYQENLDILERLGAELLPFSPLNDAALPEGADGLYIGGGYPELHAPALEANRFLRDCIRRLAKKGLPVYAECGGLMYLGKAIEREGKNFGMAGVFPWRTRLLSGRKALGYREVSLTPECPFYKRGSIRGHEFHYSEMASDPKGLGRGYMVRGGSNTFPEGFSRGNALASYIHLHFASNPAFPRAFLRTAMLFREKGCSGS
ncbi:MAG: cobyrinate a,c-diamide synthase [Deltaproteobacteria bacterium]|nr:cobyrinate a,c-diamide synthase [Deltaproteobacteria bacterium]MBZ0220213.1 cobyrinate a,c-diamide synthase [Deltaproteobacteria bacterium]